MQCIRHLRNMREKERKTREMAILRSGELVLLSKVDSLEKAKG